jgi:hypothetical protein
MLRVELEESVTMKFVAVTAAMSMLASCAIAVPLRPLASHGRGESELTCTTRCSDGNRDRKAAHRPSRPVVDGKIDDAPPDFIVNSTDMERTVR